MKKVIFWDFDGVIADSWDFVFGYWKRVFEEFDKPLSSEHFQEVFDGHDSWDIFQQYGAEMPMKEKYSLYERDLYPNDVQLFDGMMHIFALIENNFDSHIISANQKQVLEDSLKKHGARHFFQEVHGRNDPRNKSEKVISILSSYRKKPDSCFFIGDTVGDIMEAKKANVPSIGVSWGYHSYERMRKSSPDFLFRHPSELSELLLKK